LKPCSVINHRDGTNGWADFQNPHWGLWAVCRFDEAFKDPASGLQNTPENERGAEEERPTEYARHGGTTYAYGDFRDLDHTNVEVRRDIVRYLKQLRSFGYRGWRYDMVHGYHAKWIGRYNLHSEPTFSVGEYDWSAHPEQRGWIWHTATAVQARGEDRLKSASSVFDFTTYYTLKANKGRYFAWYGFRSGLGMVGDTTDGIRWKNRSVTFVENHDTGYRTEEDGSPQQHHQFDSFDNNWEVEQAYAHILTHPGVPCVYWKHYFDWTPDLRNKIRALVNARKVAGVHAGSTLHLQDNARERGVYGARVEGQPVNGDERELYVRIGGSDANWEPGMSGYTDFREYAQGADWKVWVKLPGNPPIKEAPLREPWPVPMYTPADTITPPNDP
jgi:alpha-amylase